MLFEIIIKYSMLFITFSVLVSIFVQLFLFIMKKIKKQYIKKRKAKGLYFFEDSEIPLETHKKHYMKHKEKILEKQTARSEDMRQNIQNILPKEQETDDLVKVVALAEPQGKWTKLFLDQIKAKFLVHRTQNMKNKWTFLTSLYGKSHGKYKGRYR